MGVIASLHVIDIGLHASRQLVDPCSEELDVYVRSTQKADSPVGQQRVTAPEQRIGVKDMIDHSPHGDNVEGTGRQVDNFESTADDLVEPEFFAGIPHSGW